MSAQTELAPRQATLPAVEPSRAVTPLDLISKMVESGVDADQLGKMLDLQERWEANEARKAFASAMADFQAQCPTVMKSRQADRYNYAPLDEILRTIRPHLEVCGLAVRFSTRTEGQVITVLCTVSHRAGYSEPSEFSAPVDPNMRVNETQKIGSANSYAKRYALMNALGLAASDEDDDGYSAGTALIDEEQAATIREYVDELGDDINLAKFCRWLQVETIDDIPAAKYDMAVAQLKRKQQAVSG